MVTVELTYDMSKALGVDRFELEGADTVADVVRMTRERFDNHPEQWDKLVRIAAVVVNGVVMNQWRGMRTRLADGDVVGFVKTAAGG